MRAKPKVRENVMEFKELKRGMNPVNYGHEVLSDGGMLTCLLCVVFVSAIKGIKFQRKHAKLSEYPLDEQLKILDTLGDLYCKAKAYQKALGCYKKEVY